MNNDTLSLNMKYYGNKLSKINVRQLICIFLMTIVYFTSVSSVSAQYFGRNKVQYETFDFKVLETEHFKVHYYPSEKKAAQDAARMFERWYYRHYKILNVPLTGHIPVIIYANHADFQQTNTISGLVPQGTGGVTEGLMNRIILPLTGAYTENDHVIGHELMHAFHYDLMKKSAVGIRASRQIPTWFIEGMAEYMSLGRHDTHTAMWLRDAVLHNDVPTIKQISTEAKYFPYRYGHALWAYITARRGNSVILPFYKSVLDSGWVRGVKLFTGFSLDTLSANWQRAVRAVYRPHLKSRQKPDKFSTPLITGYGGTNLSPVISPDGEKIAFLSTKDIFTLDLFLADAQTGEIIKKLASSNTDSHFDALRFMQSSGAWSPEGNKFAFVVYRKGDNSIVIMNVPEDNIQQVISFEKLNSILSLDWSPDGNSLVISGISGGVCDLFLYNIQKDSLSQLTTDRYAELQPDWSPDGKTIVFCTDRGPETDFQELDYGNIKIGFLDLKNGDISTVAMTDNTVHTNPHYSRDGSNVYFIGNPDGIANVYRYDVHNRGFYRITNIVTGISGLSELSPTMSLAENTEKMVFTAFNNTKYNIYSMSKEHLTGKKWEPDTAAYWTHTAVMPVFADPEAEKEKLTVIRRSGPGLISGTGFSLSDYNPQLRLLAVSQSSIGVSVDRYGTGIGGGVNLLFSDILGNHLVGGTAMINGTWKDIGGQVFYQNRKHQINWGGVAGHIPSRSGRMASSLTTVEVDGQQVQARELELLLQRVYVDRIVANSEYPFSINRRLEGGIGFTRMSYDYELRRQLISLGGYVLERETKDLESPDPLNFVHANLGYVGDYSYFGFTSPMRGRRFHFEVEPTIGSLQYMYVLADYRQYLFLNPVTFAFRFMHHGRYLKDAEDEQLNPMFLGYKTWVRGYSLGSIEMSECTDTRDPEECPEFDRLIGSRVGVVNVEVRIPIFGNEQFGLVNFRYLPADLVAFFDGGVAWTKHSDPVFRIKKRSAERIPVFSTGLAFRFNILGMLVAQVYYAYPFQRPEKGAHFGFVIAPGW